MSQSKDHLSIVCAKEIWHCSFSFDFFAVKAKKRIPTIALEIVVTCGQLLVRNKLEVRRWYAATLAEFLVQLHLEKLNVLKKSQKNSICLNW